MTINQLDIPAGAVELVAGDGDTGARRLREELDAYLRGHYRISAQRSFSLPGTGWVELDSHVANSLGRLEGYERQDVAWRRPGKDLFAIHKSQGDIIAIGLIREPGPDGRTLAGYFQLDAAVP